MKNVKISFSSLEDIKEFNKVTCSNDCNVELSSGNYKVDAKSLVGLFTFDINQKLDLTIYSDNYADYLSQISKFLVD